MSFERIFERFNRLARSYAPEYLVRGRTDHEALNEAEALITEQERRDAARREAKRLEAERAEDERLETERVEAERREAERLEEERIEAELNEMRQRAGTMKSRPQRESALRLLGLQSGATQQEITRAYRLLIVRHHPDRNNHRTMEEQAEARRITQELNAAYAVLRASGGV